MVTIGGCGWKLIATNTKIATKKEFKEDVTKF